METIKKITTKHKTIFFFLLLLLISTPSVVRMIRPGLFSMQDFPYFRVVEYTKCLRDFQIPCRWAPDAGLGFGEPVFNFYSHIPFFISSLISLLGFSTTFALKFVFGISLVGSSISMFILARKVWGNNLSGIVSAVLYLYAPYRAVNVWVRGALPESFAFIIIPLILYCFEMFLETSKKLWFISFSLCLSLLILTHNLSVVLFAPVIIFWVIYRVNVLRKWKTITPFIFAGILSILLSGYYLVPSIFESRFVNLESTTLGYFDFRAHFVTLQQLFISRVWGYGGSTWGPVDNISLSVGHLQWIVGIIVLIQGVMCLKTKKLKQNSLFAVFLVLLGVFCIFMSHNQSTPLWELFSSVMKYIQFPWRFIGAAVFSLSIAGGYLFETKYKYSKYIALCLIVVALVLNVNFFKEDIWRNVSDSDLQSGDQWIEQTRASIGDYWPKYGPIPVDYAANPLGIERLSHGSNFINFKFQTALPEKVILPVNFFPGWKAFLNGTEISINPSKSGLIEMLSIEGENNLSLKFTNTTIRTVGNLLTILGVITAVYLLLTKYEYFKKP